MGAGEALTPAAVERRKELGDTILAVLHTLEDADDAEPTAYNVYDRIGPAVGTDAPYTAGDLDGAIKYLRRAGYVETADDQLEITQDGRYDSPVLGGIDTDDRDWLQEEASEPDVDAMASEFGVEGPAARIADLLGEEGWVLDSALYEHVSRPDLFHSDPTELRQLLWAAQQAGLLNSRKVEEETTRRGSMRRFAWVYTGPGNRAEQGEEPSPAGDESPISEAAEVYEEQISQGEWRDAQPA